MLENPNETIFGSFATGVPKVGSFVGNQPKAQKNSKLAIVRLKRSQPQSNNNSVTQSQINVSGQITVKKLKESIKQDDQKSLDLVDSFAECEIDQLEKKLEKCEHEHISIEKQKVALSKNKSATKRMQVLQLRELDEQIHRIRMRQERILRCIDSKTPFYEKLPKDSQFYQHFMAAMYMKKISDAGSDLLDSEKAIMRDVKKTLVMV